MRLRLMIATTALVLWTSTAWAGSIAGTVVDDASGMPVPKASIRVWSLNRATGRVPAIYPELVDFETATAGDGTFQTINLIPGNYVVAVGRTGYLYSTISAVVTDKAVVMPSVTVRLIKLGAIEGQLTELHGRSARVLALARSSAPKSQTVSWKPVLDSIAICCGTMSLRGVPVDTDGHFQIPDLPPGTYALLVAYGHTAYGDSRVPDFQPATPMSEGSSTGLFRFPDGTGGLDLDTGETLSFQLAIPEGGGRVINGRIELPEGQRWYWVTLSNPEQPALAVATTTTDPKGGFSFRGVAPGVYELLAVAGMGERGAPISATPEMTVYHGFFRASVDVREHDVLGITAMPRSGVSSSVALHARQTVPLATCVISDAVLTPSEDWGINLERRLKQVTVTPEGVRPAPEPIAGLAPTRFGLSTVGSCPVGDHPVLDLSRQFSDVEAAIVLPGVIRGNINVQTGESAMWQAILIPDDFTEGRSFLPANWFSWSETMPASEVNSLSPFAAHTVFFLGWRGAFVPYVRLANSDGTGRFEFNEVPAGRYRIALRSTDPRASPGQMSGEMKQIEVSSSAVLVVDLPAPNPTPLK